MFYLWNPCSTGKGEKMGRIPKEKGEICENNRNQWSSFHVLLSSFACFPGHSRRRKKWKQGKHSWMLMFLCNLHAPEKEKTRNGKICKWCSSFCILKTFLVIPIPEEQKRPKHILGALRTTSGFYLYSFVFINSSQRWRKMY